MSMKGNHLIGRRFGVVYYFEKGEPKEREYFVWEPTYTAEGKYSISLQYPFLDKKYGLKNSKLNQISQNTHDTIIEIDTKKFDIKSDLAYRELKHDRNRLYALKALRNFVVFCALLISCVILMTLKG